ncbi:MAG: L,D-transpeptidase [Hyphomicrobiaceae bacterium]
MSMKMRRITAASACAAAVLQVICVAPAAARPEAVAVDLGYAPGTVVIVNSERKVYYVTGAGQAIRYGVAVGKESERWTGRTFVSEKKEDPRWIPVDGSDPVEGGDPSNPLGKRALYLDWSLLRIHGTPSRGSIGSAVSNGCIRMLNEDVIDLFERVHVGAPVFAINSRQQAGAFKDAKVADLVYVNPAARLDAKSEEEEANQERRDRTQAGRYALDDDEDEPRPRRRMYVPRYRSSYGWWN